jgi:hypothetical protein
MRRGHKSRTSREIHVWFCEGLGVQLPRATRHANLLSAVGLFLCWSLVRRIIAVDRVYSAYPNGIRDVIRMSGRPLVIGRCIAFVVSRF